MPETDREIIARYKAVTITDPVLTKKPLEDELVRVTDEFFARIRNSFGISHQALTDLEEEGRLVVDDTEVLNRNHRLQSPQEYAHRMLLDRHLVASVIRLIRYNDIQQIRFIQYPLERPVLRTIQYYQRLDEVETNVTFKRR